MRLTHGQRLGLTIGVGALAGGLAGFFAAPFGVWLAIMALTIGAIAVIQRQT